MPLNDSFERIYKKCGKNPYRTSNYIAHQARLLAEEYDNEISHSEAIACVISGKKPSISSIAPIYTNKYNLPDRVAQLVSDIYEPDIREAVKQSLDLSIENHRLMIEYGDVSNEAKQSRIRILVKMLFDELNVIVV